MNGQGIAIAFALLVGVIAGAGIMYVGLRMGGRMVWRAVGKDGDPICEPVIAPIDQEETD